MKIEVKYTEIIDRYLNGELSEEELKDFNKLLESDLQLRRELSLEKDLNKIILETDIYEFGNKVKATREAMLLQKPNPNGFDKTVRLRSKKWYLLAASIIVLVGLLGYLYFLQNQQISSEKLFLQYYSKYHSDIAARSGDEISNDPFILGLNEYEDDNYNDAIRYLNQEINEDSLNFTAQLYLGISYMEKNNLDKAIDVFKSIINESGNMFIGQAKWYLALTYLKTDDVDYREETKNLLSSIIQNKGDRAKEALELLDKME
jgi:predicted negative regulator of RcsB-dependent stress response